MNESGEFVAGGYASAVLRRVGHLRFALAGASLLLKRFERDTSGRFGGRVQEICLLGERDGFGEIFRQRVVKE